MSTVSVRALALLGWLTVIANLPSCGSSSDSPAANGGAGAGGTSSGGSGTHAAGTTANAGANNGGAGTSANAGSNGDAGAAGAAEAAPDPCPAFTGTPDPGQALCSWLAGKSPGQQVGQDPTAAALPASAALAVAGDFVGSIDFGDGVITDKPIADPPLTTNGPSVFLSEFDDHGRSTRALAFGTSGSQSVAAMVLDKTGAAILVGTNTGSVDFGGGALDRVDGGSFIAKFDASRKHVFSRELNANVVGVGVDTNGHSHLCGAFAGTANFGGKDLIAGSGQALFVAEFDAAGKHVQSVAFSATETDAAFGSAAFACATNPTGGMAITGYFRGTFTLPGGKNISQPGATANGYLLGLDATQKVIFTQPIPASGNLWPTPVVFDGSGNVLVTGNANADFDFGDGVQKAAGKYDLFVAKYSATGSLVKGKLYGDTSDELGLTITTDSSNTVIVAGRFGQALTFGTNELTAGSDHDLFLVKFDDTLSPLWSHSFPNGLVFGTKLAATADASDNVWLTGNVMGATDFGTGALAIDEPLDRRAFFAKFAP